MTDMFVPETKNPPAKVKDMGIVGLVLDGAGVYNAKSGEIIFLPRGCEVSGRIVDNLMDALLEKCGIQRIDCRDLEEAVYSLAERYVRDYKEKVLSWSQISGRELLFCGWAATEEDAVRKAEATASAIKDALSECLSQFSLTRVASPKKNMVISGLCVTNKGSFNSVGGVKCSVCGRIFLADSVYINKEAPVNADAEESELRDIYTPGAHTIPLLCKQLGLQPKDTLKAMLYTVESPGGGKELLFAMIRGDRDISITKLSAYVEAKFPGSVFRRAEADEIVAAFGEVAGFCGPVGVPENVNMVADMSLKDGKNFVVGGNRPDYHRTGCCWGRDFEPEVADLLLYQESVLCPECGGELKEAEVRRICTIEAYDAALNGAAALMCRDREGVSVWPYRWRGVVSLESLLLSVYERGNRDKI